MKEDILFITEERSAKCERLFDKYLSDYFVTIDDKVPANTSKYRLTVLWNYSRLIKITPSRKNIMVFHSTDLPEGRGFAPIYNTVALDRPNYVISGILIDNGADTGDIVVKAKFPMRPEYTAPILREWDEEICISLIDQTLKHFKGHSIKGALQPSYGEEYLKRLPSANQVYDDEYLKDMFNHLRACEPQHPAFYEFKGVKYIIEVKPEIKPQFPLVEVTFFK